MENTRIVKFLKSLNQYELRQFSDFVNSPAFNKKKALIKLFDELKKYYPAFTNKNLTDEMLYKKVFPGEEYDYFKLKNAISDLFILGKEFLAFLGYKKDDRLKEKFMLKELRLRDLDALFEQTFKAVSGKLNKAEVKDEHFVNHKLDLISEELSYLTPKAPNKYLNYQQDMLDQLLVYSIIRVFKIYNVMMHEEKQNTFKYEKHLFNEIMAFVEKNKFDNPTLLVYYHILLLEGNRNDENFHRLKEVGAKYKSELNEYDDYMLFLHLNGYCTNEFNINSRTDLMNEHFEIIKNKNERNYTSIGRMLYPDFLNEVKIALRVNEFDWVEEYIKRNVQKLSGEVDSTVNFANAMIHAKKRNFDKALELLARTNFPNFIIKLQVKILHLQILFGKGYYDQVISAIDSFRHYLKRETTIKENFKESFYEFVNIINNLIRIKTGVRKNESGYQLDEIKADIENMTTNQFGIKHWLRSQL